MVDRDPVSAAGAAAAGGVPPIPQPACPACGSDHVALTASEPGVFRCGGCGAPLERLAGRAPGAALAELLAAAGRP